MRWATKGPQVLAIVRVQPPALILMAVRLPGSNGLDICRRLKRFEGSAIFPVLLLTYRTEVAEQLRGFRLGAADYICKAPAAERSPRESSSAPLHPRALTATRSAATLSCSTCCKRIPLAVAFTDERGEMQFVNDRFVESFGYEPHELAGPDALRNHLRAADHTGAGLLDARILHHVPRRQHPHRHPFRREHWNQTSTVL